MRVTRKKRFVSPNYHINVNSTCSACERGDLQFVGATSPVWSRQRGSKTATLLSASAGKPGDKTSQTRLTARQLPCSLASVSTGVRLGCWLVNSKLLNKGPDTPSDTVVRQSLTSPSDSVLCLTGIYGTRQSQQTQNTVWRLTSQLDGALCLRGIYSMRNSHQTQDTVRC